MASGDILSDFGINLLEEEIDDVIFQTNEFLTDATFTRMRRRNWNRSCRTPGFRRGSWERSRNRERLKFLYEDRRKQK